MCYSDHQGQASAKRQGKFKKVLDELESLYNGASTALIWKWLIHYLDMGFIILYHVQACRYCCTEICSSLFLLLFNVKALVFWWSVKLLILLNICIIGIKSNLLI